MEAEGGTLAHAALERGPGCEISFYLTAHDSRSVLGVKGPPMIVSVAMAKMTEILAKIRGRLP